LCENRLPEEAEHLLRSLVQARDRQAETPRLLRNILFVINLPLAAWWASMFLLLFK